MMHARKIKASHILTVNAPVLELRGESFKSYIKTRIRFARSSCTVITLLQAALVDLYVARKIHPSTPTQAYLLVIIIYGRIVTHRKKGSF